jgi:hypothetical protein
LEPDELRRAKERGGIPKSHGAHTFRSEVAAKLAATLIFHQLGELGPRWSGLWSRSAGNDPVSLSSAHSHRHAAGTLYVCAHQASGERRHVSLTTSVNVL